MPHAYHEGVIEYGYGSVSSGLWRPPVSTNSLFDIFDDMMDIPRTALATKAFPIDVEDKGDSYEVKAYLTGVTKDDLDVELNEGRLSISVTVEEKEEDKNKNYLQREFTAYSATRRRLSQGCGLRGPVRHVRRRRADRHGSQVRGEEERHQDRNRLARFCIPPSCYAPGAPIGHRGRFVCRARPAAGVGGRSAGTRSRDAMAAPVGLGCYRTEGAVLAGGADVKVGGIARAPECGARAKLVVEFGSDGRASARTARLGRLFSWEMCMATTCSVRSLTRADRASAACALERCPLSVGDAVLQVARIGAAAERVQIVIALKCEDARIRQQLHGARWQHARMGGVANRVTRA